MSSSPREPLLTFRAAVVALLALVLGLVVGALGFFAYHDVATAVLVGGSAAGNGLRILDRLVGPSGQRDAGGGRHREHSSDGLRSL